MQPCQAFLQLLCLACYVRCISFSGPGQEIKHGRRVTGSVSAWCASAGLEPVAGCQDRLHQQYSGVHHSYTGVSGAASQCRAGWVGDHSCNQPHRQPLLVCPYGERLPLCSARHYSTGEQPEVAAINSLGLLLYKEARACKTSKQSCFPYLCIVFRDLCIMFHYLWGMLW